MYKFSLNTEKNLYIRKSDYFCCEIINTTNEPKRNNEYCSTGARANSKANARVLEPA
jgi:hypothetical protein